MKKKQWLRSLNGVDDQYVVEAAPSGAARKRSGKTVRIISILAACMTFVLLVGTLALFIPYRTTPPSVAAYAGSDYYGIIQKLNDFNFDPPEYKNTFELLLDLPSNLFAKAEDWLPMAPGASNEAENMTGNGNYQEVTDNQVAGVIEADLIKRSDTHIYYIADSQLFIYSIEGEDSRLQGRYNVAQYGVDGLYADEFFLSADCRTLTAVCHYMEKTSKNYVHMTRIVTLDVSNPTAVKEISHVDVSGQYLSSRLTEHGLLLMTTMRCSNADFDDERTFVPQVKTVDGMQSIAPEDIVCPDALSNASYTVMLMMDATGQTVIDSAAFLSYAEDVYVSADAIYASRSYPVYGAVENGLQHYSTLSEINCMGYGAQGFEQRGSATVDGYVLDQYSMDQFENTLRVVTTTQSSTRRVNNYYGNYEIDLMPARGGNTSANLYVIDLDTMQVIASVEQFAPVGETVRSARFEGNTAYVCTAIQQTDPVFFFDLSNLENITVKETGTIAGFSTSLIDFGDGFLLGIGRGGNGNELKLEIYTEGEDKVESYCVYERPCTDYSPEYKSYYIDRENGIVGLGIYTWDKIVYEEHHAYSYDNYRFAYIVLHFDGESIREVLHIEYPGSRGNLPGMRGVYIDGYYYVLNRERFDVLPLAID